MTFRYAGPPSMALFPLQEEPEKEAKASLGAVVDQLVALVDDALIRQNMGIKPAARPTQHALPLSSPAAAVAAALASPAAVAPRAVTLAPSPARTSPSAAAAAYLGPPPEPMSAKPLRYTRGGSK